MYRFLEFIKTFSEELETKTNQYNEEVDDFSSSKLKEKELLEKEKRKSIQSINDYFDRELSELQKEKQDHHDSLEKLKVEISIFEFNLNNFTENSYDKSEYENNNFSANIKKISGLISDFKSDNSSKDNSLFSKFFNNNGVGSFDVQLLNRIIFGLKYLENKELGYYNNKISVLERNRKIEIDRINQKYNRLLNENLNVSYNGKISVDNSSYKEILRRNKILRKDEESGNIGLLSPFYYEFNYSNYDEQIIRDITYLRELFQRRLISDKQSDKLINSVSEHLNSRFQLDKGQYLTDIFKEILHVVDFLESDENNQINLNLAEQIVTIFQRRNFEIIDINNLDNPVYFEVSEVEDSIKVDKPVIAEVISKGYALDGKVIRPAKVKMYKPIQK